MTDDEHSGGPVVLGLSSGFHDAAAALVIGGRVVAAVEQERLSRRKHDPAFPSAAAEACLRIAGLTAADVDAVACPEKPVDVVHRHLTTRAQAGPAGLATLLRDTPRAVSTQLGLERRVRRWFRERGAPTPSIAFVEHHASHAAAAFLPSPFEHAAILTVDGVGEWATASIADGSRHRVRTELELRFPDSVGLLYSAFTAYCGFRVNGGEGELMGLAPFGSPIHRDAILDDIARVDDDGALHTDARYLAYVRGRTMTSERFHRRFGGPPRPLGSPPGQREADLAASVQAATEEIMLRMARHAHRVTGRDDLCLSGGVALNCVANSRVAAEGPFRRVWVQPAAGDAGSAVGAALWLHHDHLGEPRHLGGAGDDASERDGMRGAFLGPRFAPDEIGRWLDGLGVEHRHVPDAEERAGVVAAALADGATVGWFAGRMEFGPRALGHRSILADPRSATVQHRLNAMVKERATFRPFAPAVLADRADEWFDLPAPSSYMTTIGHVVAGRRRDVAEPPSSDPTVQVAQVRSEIPAVTHVDHSARVQVVDPGVNPEFGALLAAFDEVTGCAVLLNTSFNGRDEPIVCSPDDALATARRVGLDLLVLEDRLIGGESGRG